MGLKKIMRSPLWWLLPAAMWFVWFGSFGPNTYLLFLVALVLTVAIPILKYAAREPKQQQVVH